MFQSSVNGWVFVSEVSGATRSFGAAVTVAGTSILATDPSIGIVNEILGVEAAETSGAAAESVEIDRWWGTAGQTEPIDVSWTVRIMNGGEGDYRLDIDFTGDLAGNSWSLQSDAEVIVGGAGPFELGDILNRAELGRLEVGTHEILISGFLPPANPRQQEIVFELQREVDGSYENAATFHAEFVADHGDVAESLNFPLSVETGAQATAVSGLDELVDQFAPILHFTGRERYAAPLDVASFQRTSQLPGGRAVVFDRTQLSGINGSPDPTLDLGAWADAELTANDRGVRPAIYSSVLHDAERDEIAINYYFFYPQSNWAEYGGANTHEGDWEGATVFLANIDGVWTPQNLAVSQHEQRLILLQDGLDFIPWSDLYLGAGDGLGSQPHLFVGLGGMRPTRLEGQPIGDLPFCNARSFIRAPGSERLRRKCSNMCLSRRKCIYSLDWVTNQAFPIGCGIPGAGGG